MIPIKVSFTHDPYIIAKWCDENLGVKSVSVADNSHWYIFYIPSDKAPMFILRWC